MISAAYIASYRYLPLFTIVILGAILRLYKINQAFPFDHDQEVAALAAFNFFEYGKITLIGQELSFPGFFLGPLHNWIGFIPYGLCNLQPDCVPYFYIAVGILTIVAVFAIIKKIFDQKIAIVASLIYAASFAAIGFERGASSNFFLALSSVALFFCLYQFFKGKKLYLVIGALFAGLATVNFNPVFLFSSAAFFITAAFGKEKLKLYAIAAAAFLINYFPLVIFNFRHENILLKSLGNFASLNTPDLGIIERFVYLAKSVSIPFYVNYLFQSTSPIFIALTLVAITFGLYYILKTREKFLLFLPIWIFTALLGFTFYKGPIPDYYFMQTLLPATILVSIFATRNLIFLTVFLSFFLFTNLAAAQNYRTIINYQIKKQAVDYITSDAQGKSFNVYFELPMGMNTGYTYLFKAKDRTPQEGGEFLYIIEFKSPHELDLKKYQSSFSDKTTKVKSFGYLHVFSVK